MSSKHSPEMGTILVRQAQPKYNFVGRKLPKIEEGSSKISNVDDKSKSKPMSQSNSQSNLSFNSSFSKKPVAVVEGSCQGANTNNDVKTPVTSVSSPVSSHLHLGGWKDDMILNSDGNNKNLSAQPSVQEVSPVISLGSPNVRSQAVIEDTAASLALSSITNSLSVAERLKEVENEKAQLKMDLQVQLQVNSELKRLLVASVGEDLGDRVERLVRDRAQLSFDIGGFSKKINEDYEHLDKVSIQADMWRSKYLASRVMIEELGNGRAFYSLQCHDGHDALQQMLNERHELRTNLLDTYKVLQQVKGAFDPLNSHRSQSLPSTNVLDLSRSCQQLTEAVRFRLLPAHITTAANMEIDLESWENSVTRAEQYAHELLSRPSEPPGSLKSGSSQLLPIAASPPCHGSSPHFNRFHPDVRHDNLTFTCCQCKGEISVI